MHPVLLMVLGVPENDVGYKKIMLSLHSGIVSLVGAKADRSSSFLSAPCLVGGSGGSGEWCRGLSAGYILLSLQGIVPLVEAIAGRSGVIVIAPCLAGRNYDTTRRRQCCLH